MLGTANFGTQTLQSQAPSYAGQHTLNHKASSLTDGDYKHVNLTRGNTRTKAWVSSKWEEDTSAGISPTSVVTIGQPLEIWEEEELSSGTLTGHPVPRLTAGPSTSTKHSVPLRPNRRSGDGDVELGGVGPLTAGNLATHNQRTSKINHHIHNFTSPIGMQRFPMLRYNSNVYLMTVLTRFGICNFSAKSFHVWAKVGCGPFFRTH
jgi:hypothetical protein